MKMSEIYYIGGSPCSGKSTVSEKLAEKYGFDYYRVDDDLFAFMEEAAAAGDELLTEIMGKSTDQMWLRDPENLHDEELTVYKKIFPYYMEKFRSLRSERPLIVEGAALLPDLIHGAGVKDAKFLAMVPTKEFQVKHYSMREWVDEYLADCSNMKAAFANWMDRDALFAKAIHGRALALGYKTLVVDGSKSLDETFDMIVDYFGLK
jgi:2-phosphoglycerate kinase